MPKQLSVRNLAADKASPTAKAYMRRVVAVYVDDTDPRSPFAGLDGMNEDQLLALLGDFHYLAEACQRRLIRARETRLHRSPAYILRPKPIQGYGDG